MGEMIVNHSAT